MVTTLRHGLALAVFTAASAATIMSAHAQTPVRDPFTNRVAALYMQPDERYRAETAFTEASRAAPGTVVRWAHPITNASGTFTPVGTGACRDYQVTVAMPPVLAVTEDWHRSVGRERAMATIPTYSMPYVQRPQVTEQYVARVCAGG